MQQPIQRLTNGTGLHLTTPLNPVTLNRFTHSIQSSNGPTRRYDYIFPNPLLHANIQSAQVFRSDLLNPLPPTLNTNDSATASDHLPVQIVFNHLPVRRALPRRPNMGTDEKPQRHQGTK